MALTPSRPCTMPAVASQPGQPNASWRDAAPQFFHGQAESGGRAIGMHANGLWVRLGHIEPATWMKVAFENILHLSVSGGLTSLENGNLYKIIPGLRNMRCKKTNFPRRRINFVFWR